MRKPLLIGAALLLAMAAAPAAAQFSESYYFLKAVRERDGNKATEMLSKPGSVIVDTKDITSGESGLHIVTKGRDLVWLNFLLSRGARPDPRDKEGNTPLIICTQLRFIEGATALIKYRAAVDLPGSGGTTPLIMAVQMRDPAMVRLLLTNGANPDKTDSAAGLSARDYAKRDPRAAAILKIFDEVKVKPKIIQGPKL